MSNPVAVGRTPWSARVPPDPLFHNKIGRPHETKWHCAFVRAVIALLPILALHAQVSSGALVGDVRDTSSALVSGVKMTLRNDATGYTRSTISSGLGAYQFVDLAPGTYTVTAEKQGFRTTTVSSVLIEVDHKSRLDVDLQVGSEHETMTVTANSSPVQSEDASAGYTLDSATIAALPLDGRNITSLVTLGPGAIPRQFVAASRTTSSTTRRKRAARWP